MLSLFSFTNQNPNLDKHVCSHFLGCLARAPSRGCGSEGFNLSLVQMLRWPRSFFHAANSPIRLTKFSAELGKRMFIIEQITQLGVGVS